MDLESRIAALEAENEKLKGALAEGVLLAFETAILADYARQENGEIDAAAEKAVKRARMILEAVGHEELYGELGA